jgi:hypothetical protein
MPIFDKLPYWLRLQGDNPKSAVLSKNSIVEGVVRIHLFLTVPKPDRTFPAKLDCSIQKTCYEMV